MKTPVGVETAVGETPSLTGEFLGETHRGLERAQTHPVRKQPQKGPLCLWVVEAVTEIRQRVEQAPLPPIDPCPIYSITGQPQELPCPGEYLRLRPFT